MPWIRKWQPTTVCLPGESHGQKSLASPSSLGCRVRHDWATNISFKVPRRSRSYFRYSQDTKIHLFIIFWTLLCANNQSILKEISPEYSLEGLTLKLKLQCFGHLMQRTDSLEKTLMQGKEKGRQRMKWLESIIDSMGMNWANSGRQWRTGKPGVLQSPGSQNRTRLSDWSIAS